VLSHEAAVELVNRITGANNLKNVSRREIVENMFTIVAGDGVDAVEIDELIVRAPLRQAGARLLTPSCRWC